MSALSLLFTPALAVPITFDLRDTTATAEIESGLITRGGITATLTPLVQGGTGSFNQTANGFGVDAAGTGDVTFRLDSGLGAEWISILFDAPVTFLGLNLFDYSVGESASLQIGGFPALSLTAQAAATDVYTFATDNLLLAGESAILRHLGGNGFSFDNFTVELAEIAPPPVDGPVTSVPDGGSTALLLGLPLFALYVIRKRGGP